MEKRKGEGREKGRKEERKKRWEFGICDIKVKKSC